MNQCGRVDEFECDGERQCFIRIGWMKTRREYRERRTNTLATAIDKRFENIRERLKVDSNRVMQTDFGLLQFALNRGKYRINPQEYPLLGQTKEHLAIPRRGEFNH